jgi:hypothetical protein
MGSYKDLVVNTLLDRSPQEWIVAIGIALLLALAVAGTLVACRRWLKVTDDTAPLVGLSLLAIFGGMVIGGIYVQLERRGSAGMGADARPPGAPGQGQGKAQGKGAGFGGFTTRLAGTIIENADVDHDGVLSMDEAANAAAKFVKETDPSGKGGIDRETLQNALRERLRPPGQPQPAPSTTKTAEPQPASPKPAPSDTSAQPPA